MATQQVTPITCPNCQARFNAPVQNIINGEDMAQKSALLQGQLNLFQCPQCGFTGAINTAILYYDLSKELALVYTPGGFEVAHTEQERIIGQLTNTVINSLPTEQRKFYLFNPKQFLKMDSLIKAVLEADGITEEMIEAQNAKANLIENLLQSSDEEALQQKIKENTDQIDQQFFEIITTAIQASQMEGNANSSQALFMLRTMAAEAVENGEKMVREIDDQLGIVFIKSHHELIERLLETKNDTEMTNLIASTYSMLDYAFFQELTTQIDAAHKANAADRGKELTELRTKVLEIKEQYETMVKGSMQKSADLLSAILQSDNPEKLLGERLEEIDESFFMVLSANIEEAQRQNHPEAAQAMATIGNMAMSMIQEKYGQPAGETAPLADDGPPASPTIEIARSLVLQ